jgi:hypothetical protein
MGLTPSWSSPSFQRKPGTPPAKAAVWYYMPEASPSVSDCALTALTHNSWVKVTSNEILVGILEFVDGPEEAPGIPDSV